jgi:hypothetical protein
LIFRGLFFEHNADIGQKDHLWMYTNDPVGGYSTTAQQLNIFTFPLSRQQLNP